MKNSPNYMIPITETDEVWTINEFIELIKDRNNFPSKLGCAYYSTNTAISNHKVALSRLYSFKNSETFIRKFVKAFPKYTHITWISR